VEGRDNENHLVGKRNYSGHIDKNDSILYSLDAATAVKFWLLGAGEAA
jgi:hypothetical protein